MDSGLSKPVATARLVIGFLQGLALYLLYHAAQDKIWPWTDRLLYAPLLLVTLFLPLVLLFGIGVLRRRALAAWAGVALMILIGLALHDAIRAESGDVVAGGFLSGWRLGATLSLMLVALTALALFIAQSLVTAGDAAKTLIAPYPRYFEAAWKLELQVALAGLFVLLFWILLSLGAGLLSLIEIGVLRRLIRHAWFSVPVTTVALAAAIQLTDVRASIISGTRTLIHGVLSWLLPMIAAIVGIFLVSLPFTGLALLWRTAHAGALLLAVAGALVILINTVYRDGGLDQPAPRALRIGASLAAIELVPIVAIAALAVGLRVAQHGWTVDRVYAAAATVVAACYAAGYIAAVASRGPWLKRLERCNILTAFAILATLLALLTPLADPARIAVASQIARLKAGAIAADQFDYAYLRRSGERYGKEALNALASDSDAAIKDGAARALRATNPLAQPGFAQPVIPPPDLAAVITVYPAGRRLPDSFLRQTWPVATQFTRPQCFNNIAFRCDAFLIDLDGDGVDEIVVMDAPLTRRAVVFKADAGGSWNVVGDFAAGMACDGVRDALKAGQFSLSPSPWKDLNVAGKTIRMGPPLPNRPNCP